MPITAEQRATRSRYLGSSDAPAVCGEDPYRSAADVWATKVYEVTDVEPSEVMELGNLFEPALIRYAEKRFGFKFEQGGEFTSGVLISHPDGVDRERRVGCEAKFTGLRSEWGTEGSDEVPPRVLVQSQVHCLCADLDSVVVPVLLADFDRPRIALYQVPRHDSLIASISERCETFWRDYVVPKVPPPPYVPALEVLERIARRPETVTEIEAGAVAKWRAAREARIAAKTAEDEARAPVIAALGEAEAGDFGDPDEWITYYQQHRRAYAVEACDYRTLRVSKRGGR
jgi:predicted phage-related endonuclease